MAQTGEPAVQAEGPDEGPIAIFYTEDHAEYARVNASADGWMPPALPSVEGSISTGQEAFQQKTE